jgi:hypothetical protein
VSYGDEFRITWPNDTFELSSSDPGVAVVSPDGSLTATGIGEATIHARLGRLSAADIVRVLPARSWRRKLAIRTDRRLPKPRGAAH